MDSVAFLSHSFPPHVLERIAARRIPVEARSASLDPDALAARGWIPISAVEASPPPPHSDFVDGDEFHRFQSLPPLANTDPSAVDWDDLLDRLARVPVSGETRDPS